MIKVFILTGVLAAVFAASPAESGFARHRAAAPGAEMKVLNPDISAVVETQVVFSEDKSVEDRNRAAIKEVELVFQTYVYPGVFGNVVVGMHPHGDHWDVDAEEAYVSFYELPWGLQADVGRKLVDFGRINPVHKHDWQFASFPLAYETIFGDHAWSDTGVQVSKLVPNPWNRYVNLRLGWWAGADIGHHHNDDDHHHHGAGGREFAALNGHDHHHHHGGLEFAGRVFTGRISSDLFHTREHDALAGFSAAVDERNNALYGFDLVYRRRRPFTHRRFRWQSEAFFTDTDRGSTAGFYSLAQISLNNYWDIGVRYDWTELTEDNGHHHHGAGESGFAALNGHDHHHHHGGDEAWAVSLYATHRFSETVYLRPEYRYGETGGGSGKSTMLIQFVWGFGPHAHPVED